MDEADFVPLSALQHYAYCPRQCALIHLEQIWEENSHTAEGRLMHERAHSGESTARGQVRLVTDLPLRQSGRQRQGGCGGIQALRKHLAALSRRI